MNKTIEKLTIEGVTYVPEGSQPKPAVDDEGLRYAIVRSRDQGVMCGFVKSVEGRRVTLVLARQMWRWSSKFVLTDAAEHGVTEKWENKFSCEASQETEMLEACGILYCTDKAMVSLRAVEPQVNDD